MRTPGLHLPLCLHRSRHKIYKEQKIDSISVLYFGQNNSDSSENVRSRYAPAFSSVKSAARPAIGIVFCYFSPQLPGLEIGSLWAGAKWVFGISSLPRRGHAQVPYTLCSVGIRRGHSPLISARSRIALLVEHQARRGISVNRSPALPATV